MANTVTIDHQNADGSWTTIASYSNVSGGLLMDVVGHSPGAGTHNYRVVVQGDTTFQGGIGRTSILTQSVNK